MVLTVSDRPLRRFGILLVLVIFLSISFALLEDKFILVLEEVGCIGVE